MRKKFHCFPYCNSQPPVLVFGVPNPLFSADFRPVSGFPEAGGILTLPQRKKRHTGATVAFVGFSQWWCVLFQKCISSYKPGFPKCRNDFSVLLSVPQQRQKSYLQHLRSYNETAAVIRKIQVSQQLFRFCYTCNTSAATRCCPGFSQPYPCTTIPRGHCFRCRSEPALCSALDRDRSDFPRPML